MWKRIRILGKVSINRPENIIIGTNVSLNEGVYFNSRDLLQIGDHVHISPFCVVNTGSLDYTKKLEKRKHVSKKVIIEDGVWLGSGVIINPGVTVGENSVVGAGSIVTKSIPKNVAAFGNPAKVYKHI